MKRPSSRLIRWTLPLAVLGVGAAWVVTTPPAPAADDVTEPAPPATAEVMRRDIVQTEKVDGTLGYGEAESLPNRADGIVTWVPQVGAVIEPGDTAYRVDERPTVAIRGDVPMFRTLRYGDEGDDVRQVQQFLVDAGFADFEPDGEFGRATRSAVRDWQASLDRKRTGVVEVSDVVVIPNPVRVAAVVVAGSVAGDHVLNVTAAEPQVDVDLDPTRRHLAVAGSEVDIELPDGDTVTGRVGSVGDVVETSDSGTPSVDVIIDLAVDAAWEGAPVKVVLVRRAAEGVLAVPVSALLALAEGGYAVELVSDSGPELTGVGIGDAADGWVEVSGAVSEGDQVVVAR